MIENKGSQDWIKVQAEPLSVMDALGFLGEGNVGGIDIFVGTTRRFTDGKETVRLEYDTYPEMAVAELTRIGSEALERWPLERVVLIHRSGVVACGEASVIVGASAAHRSAAFEACRFLIDTLKERAPIWKKEHFADGSMEWVEEGSVVKSQQED